MYISLDTFRLLSDLGDAEIHKLYPQLNPELPAARWSFGRFFQYDEDDWIANLYDGRFQKEAEARSY